MLICAGLFSLLVLGPRVVQWEDLARQHQQISREHRQLDQRIKELESLAFALEHDPAYARKVAMQEFDLTVQGVGEVPLIGLDKPTDTAVPIIASLQQPAWLPWIRWTAPPGPVRSRLTVVTAVLCLTAFVCLHEQFFAGGVGKHLHNIAAWITARYARAYR